MTEPRGQTRTDGVLTAALAGSPVFAGTDPSVIERLAATARLRTLKPGEILMREGEPAGGCYVLTRGRLRATTTAGTSGDIGRGEVVGEMALLSDERRTATVTAVRSSDVVEIDQATFLAIVAETPEVLRRITTRVIGRMRTSSLDQPRFAMPTVVAVVGLHRPPDPAWIAALGRALSAEGVTVDCLPADRFRAADAATVEAATDLVIIAAAPGDGGASRGAIAAADLVLLVAEATDDPAPTPTDLLLADHPSTPAELVLHQGATIRPGTVRWIEHRDLRRHHHVRTSRPGDIARLGRMILGRHNALVLSGGGAKGLAHIGVLDVIDELNIPIDIIGGTSAGSIIAGAAALGLDPQSIARHMQELMVDDGTPLDFTFPTVSIASGGRIAHRLRTVLGEIDLSDLPVEMFAVSTNLTRGCRHIHRRGPLWRVVRSSVAVPGVFPPMPDGADLLVDGGVLENFPVGPMRELAPGGTVIGVNVGRDTELDSTALQADGVISGWQFLRNRLRPGETPRPATVARVLVRITELSGIGSSVDPGDVQIRPDVAGIGMFDWPRLDELRERGAAAARPVLEDWVRGAG